MRELADLRDLHLANHFDLITRHRTVVHEDVDDVAGLRALGRLGVGDADVPRGQEARLEQHDRKAIMDSPRLADLFIHVHDEQRAGVLVGHVGDRRGEVLREPPRVEVVLRREYREVLACQRRLGEAA